MDDGWFIFLCRAAERGISKIFSLLARRAFAACGPGLDLPAWARLRGLSRIRVGSGFRAAKALWLEAVVTLHGRHYELRIEINSDVALSDNVHIAATSRMTIGDDVIGSRILITDHAHGLYHGRDQTDAQCAPNDRPLTKDGTVIIGNTVWINGAIVLPGAKMSDGSIIGAMRSSLTKYRQGDGGGKFPQKFSRYTIQHRENGS
jgi:acetyltransferase-like isoleucine patch superfamily enzyme